MRLLPKIPRLTLRGLRQGMYDTLAELIRAALHSHFGDGISSLSLSLTCTHLYPKVLVPIHLVSPAVITFTDRPECIFPPRLN